jgi:heterodisulfide reductase subunit B
MPVDWKKYPENWKAIARKVKTDADWHCQGCRKPCRRGTSETWEQFRDRLPPGLIPEFEKRQRFTLTVAHLDHNPQNCEANNLRALCSVCHLRYDRAHHAKTRRGN